MGQTQLLLVILGVVVVGIAIFVGINMFGSNASEANRLAVINDLQNSAATALTYYNKATTQGGGGKSFVGLTSGMVCPKADNPNGRYFVESATADACSLMGVGSTLAGDDSVRVRIRVTQVRNTVEILN